MDEKFSCTQCGVVHCASRKGQFPGKCLTTADEHQEISQKALDLSLDGENQTILQSAAQVEGNYYGRLTRVEETIIFAKKIGANKIGIASCMGLIEESKILVKALKINGLEAYSVLCKVGAHDKTKLGIDENDKIHPNQPETACNPIMQALICNHHKTDLNVIMGLCVGHDSLFIKYAEAPVTYLVVKDRVLAHNPVGALYASCSYYSRIIDKPIEE